MKAQFRLTGETHELHLTTEHPCSSYGQPVAVTEDGQAIDVVSWAVYRVVSATPEELKEFAAAGYVLGRASARRCCQGPTATKTF